MIMLDIKVIPSSGKQAWKLEGDMLKCYLKSPPEDGKANRELVMLLAKTLGISASAITIVLGATARKKRVRIDAAITRDMIFTRLGIMQQMSLFE